LRVAGPPALGAGIGRLEEEFGSAACARADPTHRNPTACRCTIGHDQHSGRNDLVPNMVVGHAQQTSAVPGVILSRRGASSGMDTQTTKVAPNLTVTRLSLPQPHTRGARLWWPPPRIWRFTRQRALSRARSVAREALIVETVSATGPPDMHAHNCGGPYVAPRWQRTSQSARAGP
jgi:hypothetical protein